jgi:hypothetical protein
MPENAANPPFSLEAKKKIAKVVRDALATPTDNRNVARPAYPRSAVNLPVPQYLSMVLQATAQNTLGADFIRAHTFEGEE